MDGVLVDSEPFIAEAAIRMFAERGYALRPEDFHPFVGMGEDRFLGGPAEVRGIVLDLPAAKDRTYALYLDLIRGRLGALAGAREFARPAADFREVRVQAPWRFRRAGDSDGSLARAACRSAGNHEGL